MNGMKRIHIVNPKAGHGAGKEHLARYFREGDTVYETTAVADAERYVRELLSCDGESEYHLHIYGGDGTFHEAVNGVMQVGGGKRCVLSLIPTGTGNDFVRMFSQDEHEIREIDVFSVNGRYSVNMVNIGFDCAVVAEAAELKKNPLLRGPLAYIAGVLRVFFRKSGVALHVTWTDADGNRQEFTQDCFLCAIANGGYCGGGFRAAPTASVTDGLCNLLLVDVIPKKSFLSLIGMYRNGTHVNGDGTLVPKAERVMRYIPVREATVSGMKQICLDGEVIPCEEIALTVIPNALRYQPNPEAVP